MTIPTSLVEWTELFEKNEQLWSEKMIELLEQNRLNEIDTVNLKVYLIEMGASNKREVKSKITTLLLHLLKWLYQPTHRSRSWRVSIIRERKELKEIFIKNTNLEKYAHECFDDSFTDAIKYAEIEIKSKKKLPKVHVFSVEQALDNNFWPEP